MWDDIAKAVTPISQAEYDRLYQAAKGGSKDNASLMQYVASLLIDYGMDVNHMIIKELKTRAAKLKEVM